MANSTFMSKRGLIRSKEQAQPPMPLCNDLELSITLEPNEIQRVLDMRNIMGSGGGSRNEYHMHNTLSASNFFGNSFFADGVNSERSVLEATPSELSHKEKVYMLFPQFVEILQSRTSDSEVFETIQDLIQTCSGVLEEVVKEGYRTNSNYKLGGNFWLEQEQNTWKLLHALYKDRIMLQTENMDYELPSLGCFEKEVITQLYTCNSNVREYQLVVDWLEACYIKKDFAQVGHTTDLTVGWENTLFQLQCPQGVAFGNSCEIVKSMDPDAPQREKKSLHCLDEEDNLRLSKCIFTEIRQGKIEEAMALCKYCGQTWRAAILEGWRLHDDPNYDSGNVHEKIPIEGNPRRDIWKKCAWMMADSKKFDEYTRAIAGSFCGHLESLKALLNNSWEDLLWAYLKVQIDIRVESEIRSCCMKSYHKMPEAYWNAKMSMEQIFDELAVHNDADVRRSAKNKFNIIQKYLILDNIPELLQHMRSWVEESNENKVPLSSHMLRFLTHIVLFMRQINKIDREETADLIVTAYVECLINIGDPQLVAFYTAALPGKMQINLYSKFLEKINDSETRLAALSEAVNAGLDVENIARTTVQTIRERYPDSQDDDIDDRKQQGDICKFDLHKIRALEWLTFYPEHRSELIWQTNAMIRTFLAEGKTECMRESFNMVPPDSLALIISLYGSKDNLPCREECLIKEYLSYKIYISSLDSFNDWHHIYHNRPKEPQLATSKANFTERIASEHKERAYHAEIERWNLTLIEQAKVTRDALFNVLLFPEKGWLIDPDTPKDPVDIEQVDWKNREIQMEKLRSICIPEIVLLLHKILHLSGDYKGCIKLADDISSESRQLYKVYTKHKLAELISKISESSLSLLNEKLDAWGYPMTA